MKLAITGNKEFNNYTLFCSTLDRISDISELISGGAVGTDSKAKRYAEERNIDFLEFPPDYKLYGNEAKFERNRSIVENCDSILAFWDGNCKGTGYTIEYGRKLKKPVRVIKIHL